jgi:hypothetical protein
VSLRGAIELDAQMPSLMLVPFELASPYVTAHTSHSEE